MALSAWISLELSSINKVIVSLVQFNLGFLSNTGLMRPDVSYWTSRKNSSEKNIELSSIELNVCPSKGKAW